MTFGNHKWATVIGTRFGTNPASGDPFFHVADQPAWTADAACTGIDIPTGRISEDGLEVETLFYPIKGGSVKKAKDICAGCPVQAECLDAALTLPAGEDWGIRGGLSKRERDALRGGWTPVCPDCGVETAYSDAHRPLLCDGCRDGRRARTRRLSQVRRAA